MMDCSYSPSTDDELVYAVGDIHGRFDLMVDLMRRILADKRACRPDTPAKLVLLGDYVDRGPQSREVLDAILELQPFRAFDLVTLKGNHEASMLRFLEEPAFGSTWASFGGTATLASYGVKAPRLQKDEDGWARARDLFAQQLPASHLALLKSLQTLHIIGDYAFVHAGVRPGVALSDQSEQDLLWIRSPFLDADAINEKVIVHGHTPSQAPYDGVSRIGVDTGAYATGVLTAVRLSGQDRRFLQGSVR